MAEYDYENASNSEQLAYKTGWDDCEAKLRPTKQQTSLGFKDDDGKEDFSQNLEPIILLLGDYCTHRVEQLKAKDVFSLLHWVDESYLDAQPQMSYKIAEVLHFGAKKYAWGDWRHVANAEERYWKAFLRHFKATLEDSESVDSESGLKHVYHAYVNLMFLDMLNKGE